MRAPLFFALLVVSVTSLSRCTAQKPPTTQGMTTIYVVRHAEKLTSDFDTPLSPAGEQRAEALAERLADAGVQQIYATTRQRTQRTVGPLATRLGLVPLVMEPGAVDSLVQRIKRDDVGKTVLVAGHNNTVPQIVLGLSGQAVDAIPETVFDRLFQVELRTNGEATVTVLQYGAPTP